MDPTEDPRMWKVRIDLLNCDVPKVLAFMDSWCSAYAYCTEEGSHGGNPHMHFYCEGKECPTRHYFRQLAGSGNKSYSLVEMQDRYPIEYLSYLTKHSTLYYVNIPEDIQSNVLTYAKEIIAKMKAKKKEIIWKQILKQMQEEGWDSQQDNNHEKVLMRVIDFHMEHEMLLRKFQIEAIADTLIAHLSPTYGRYYLVDSILQRPNSTLNRSYYNPPTVPLRLEET